MMMAAIKARDADTVERLVRQHIDKGRKAVLDMITREENQRKSA